MITPDKTKIGSMSLLAVALFLISSLLDAGEAWKDIIPKPKETRLLGKDWDLPDRTVIVIDDFPKAKIGGDEINERLQRLGHPRLQLLKQVPADAVMVIRVTCPPKYPAQLQAWPGEKPELTPESPGQQGYVIDSAERNGRKEILLAGSDEMGALYACVTFRWMLEKSKTGASLSRVSIRDWPDFKWRGAPSILFYTGSLPTNRARDRAKSLKTRVDWFLRRKINVLRDYAYYRQATTPPTRVDWMAELNDYAHERGFLSFILTMTAIATPPAKPPHPDLKNCAQVNPRKWFTWADDRALRKQADSLAQYCANNGFNVLGLHPPDGGGVMDPSQFSKRSAFDRQRWSDDQRAEADAHVFNTFYAAARKHQPEIQVAFTIYPYSAGYLDYDLMKRASPELTPEIYRRNVTGYYEKIRKLIPKDAYMLVREGKRHHLEAYRKYFLPRPLLTWCDFAARYHRQPYFTSISRFIGTSWFDNSGDIMSAMHTRVRPNLMMLLSNAEYTWNARAPGFESYDGSKDELLRHIGEPKVVYDEWVPRACRNIWGPVAGPLLAPVFQQGLNAALLSRTATVLTRINRSRRARGEADAELTTQMLAHQEAGAEKALVGLERAVRDRPSMDEYAFRLAVYYYRRGRLIYAQAKVRHHIQKATELADADRDAEASSEVKAGQEFLAEELPRLETMATETEKLPHITTRFRYGKARFSLIHKEDLNFESYRKSLASIERRLSDKGRKLVPLAHEGTIRVGIYNGGLDGGSAIGQQGVLMTFKDKPGIEAGFITDLSLGSLVKNDCIVYPQCKLGRSSTRYDFFKGLRRYVEEAGGAVWFMHDSVGTTRSEFGQTTTFPEVCLGARERADSNQARIVRHAITSGFEKDATIEHSYYDHWFLRRNRKAGRSILMGEKGAIWVAGQVGKGRVLYDGTILLTPKGNQPVAAKGDHEKLMINALKWLTQRK